MTTNLLKSNSQGVPSAAFTGHRHIPHVKYSQIKGRLKVAIYNAYLQGVRNFRCGMAVGFDMLAAEAVLELKEQLHDISLSAILPYRNQSERFAPSAREKYNAILEKADDVTVLSEDYYTRCFHERDDYMIRHSSLLIAYFDGTPKGGTFYTYNKAASKGVPVNNLYIP